MGHDGPGPRRDRRRPARAARAEAVPRQVGRRALGRDEGAARPGHDPRPLADRRRAAQAARGRGRVDRRPDVPDRQHELAHPLRERPGGVHGRLVRRGADAPRRARRRAPRGRHPPRSPRCSGSSWRSSREPPRPPIAAIDLGAESGRVVVRAARGRPHRARGRAPLPQPSRAPAGRPALEPPLALRRGARRPARGGRDARAAQRRRRRLGRRLRAARRARPRARAAVPLPRRAHRRHGRARARARAARRAVPRHRHPDDADQHGLPAARRGGRREPRRRLADRARARPDRELARRRASPTRRRPRRRPASSTRAAGAGPTA